MELFKNAEFELDHLGIAVASLDEGAKFYHGLGLKQMHVEAVPTEKVKVGMFELGNATRVELLEPTSADSPVAKFLDKRGPGIHHICFRVGDIRASIKRLVDAGAQMINVEPRPGAHDCLVAFVHPKSTGGVLVELSQPAAKGGG